MFDLGWFIHNISIVFRRQTREHSRGRLYESWFFDTIRVDFEDAYQQNASHWIRNLTYQTKSSQICQPVETSLTDLIAPRGGYSKLIS